MQAAGVTMTVISNAKQYRVVPFAQKLGMKCVWLAAKPLPFGLWRGVRRLGLRRRECAVVGDQTFTDILGAKLGGLKCVQVLPMRIEEDKPFFVFKRRLESQILKRYRKKEKVT
jgi:HAD superfamily phosphatase (TIGR01668 family)